MMKKKPVMIPIIVIFVFIGNLFHIPCLFVSSFFFGFPSHEITVRRPIGWPEPGRRGPNRSPSA